MKTDFGAVIHFINLGYSLQSARRKADTQHAAFNCPTEDAVMRQVHSIKVTLKDGSSVEAFENYTVKRHP